MSLSDRLAEHDICLAVSGRKCIGNPPLQGDLIEFHRAMSVPILPTPQVPADDRVRLRAKLIVEECFEFLEAIVADDIGVQLVLDECRRDLNILIQEARVFVSLPEAADALADIAYVVEGANLEFGIDSGPVLDEVHRANMAKAGGPRRSDGKVMKPTGWTPPDIAGVLERQR